MKNLNSRVTRFLHATVSVALFLAPLAPSRLLSADAALPGDWAGGFEDGADYVFVQLHFQTKESEISGTYDAPLLFQQGLPLKQVSRNGSTMKFELLTQPNTRLFTGEIKDGVFSGPSIPFRPRKKCGMGYADCCRGCLPENIEREVGRVAEKMKVIGFRATSGCLYFWRCRVLAVISHIEDRTSCLDESMTILSNKPNSAKPAIGTRLQVGGRLRGAAAADCSATVYAPLD